MGEESPATPMPRSGSCRTSGSSTPLHRRRRRQRAPATSTPHGDIRIGQAFMSDIAHNFMTAPQWHSGALFIDYVERVGFDYKPWKPSDVFSQPDSTVKGILGKP